MEQRIRDRFHPAVLREAMNRHGLAEGSGRPLDGFESFIYDVDGHGPRRILRLSHTIRRSEALIQGEVEWINHLADGGTSVARAVPSPGGHLVEAVDDGQGGHFLATVFENAPGRPPWEVGWTPELHRTYGALLGRIHRLSVGYEPPRGAWRRPHWDDPIMLDAERWLPESEAAVLDHYRELMVHLRDLPRDGSSYGLIHQDAHGGNLFIDDGGRITLFDFDDCVYSWFANDLAIVLFYAVMGEKDPNAFAHRFLESFLAGYRTEARLDPEWIEELPHFLKLREIDLYAVIHRSFDVAKLDDPWCARFMDGRRERIERGVPYLDIDLARVRGWA